MINVAWLLPFGLFMFTVGAIVGICAKRWLGRERGKS